MIGELPIFSHIFSFCLHNLKGTEAELLMTCRERLSIRVKLCWERTAAQICVT